MDDKKHIGIHAISDFMKNNGICLSKCRLRPNLHFSFLSWYFFLVNRWNKTHHRLDLSFVAGSEIFKRRKL